jgi:hypothetical protein
VSDLLVLIIQDLGDIGNDRQNKATRKDKPARWASSFNRFGYLHCRFLTNALTHGEPIETTPSRCGNRRNLRPPVIIFVVAIVAGTLSDM